MGDVWEEVLCLNMLGYFCDALKKRRAMVELCRIVYNVSDILRHMIYLSSEAYRVQAEQ